MKKMLVLVMVLGLASLTNAAISFYVNGSPAPAAVNINPGEVLTLQLYSGDTLAWNAYVIQGTDTVSGIGSLTNPINLANAGDMKSNSPYAAADGWGNGFLFGTGGSPSGLPVAGIQHTVDFSSPVVGTANLYLYDGTSYNELDSLAVTVVPEPVTMALLGIGGLFLRRRK
ncbi:MAG: hypothetical protein A2Y12_09535 [Planctomycetes bacterium GWF2_42_9]|nr:MAG: hypothetical protein A2Y12_09535 [Planctomycetes bacterium GWF2_42_9]